MIERARLRLPARARPPPRDAPRRAGAALARRAHRLQPARAADEPGRRPPPADRRVRAAVGRADGRRRSRALGCEHGMVVHGEPGIDELSPCGATHRRDRARRRASRVSELDARELGIELCALSDLAGGDPQRNAEIALAVLGGEPGPGGRRHGAQRRARRSWWRGARPISAKVWSRRARHCAPERQWRRCRRCAPRGRIWHELSGRHRGVDARAARGAPRDALAGGLAARTPARSR